MVKKMVNVIAYALAFALYMDIVRERYIPMASIVIMARMVVPVTLVRE